MINYAKFCGGCGGLLRLIGKVLIELGQDKNVIAAIGVAMQGGTVNCTVKYGEEEIKIPVSRHQICSWL